MEQLRAALRFSGVRWTIAMVASIGLGAILRRLLSYAPRGVSTWPAEAIAGTGHLIDLVDTGQFAMLATWLLLVTPRWGSRLRSQTLRVAIQIVLLAGACSYGSAAAIELWRGVEILHRLPLPGAWVVGSTAARVALVPLAIATAPLIGLALYERVAAIVFFRRVVRTGRGANAGWMESTELKKFCQPLPRNSR